MIKLTYLELVAHSVEDNGPHLNCILVDDVEWIPLADIIGASYATLPIMWDNTDNPADGEGGEAVSDPLTVYVHVLCDGPGSIPSATWKFSITDCVADLIGAIRPGDGEPIASDAPERIAITKLRAALVDQIAVLDAACHLPH